MKAIICTKYGPPEVLKLKEIDKPVPRDNEVLIKIYATTVTSGDCEQRGLKLQFWYRVLLRAYVGLKRPKRITILGMDLAGEIESAGKDVKRFSKGDKVFGSTGFVGMGAYAQYICLTEEPEGGAMAIKPTNMTYEEASAVPNGGLEALCFLRQGNIESGQKILINGAGGTIGPYAIQLAKYFGAKVAAVDGTEKLDMLRSIGADQAIDYTKEDFTKNDQVYDFILDIVGKSPFSGSMSSLNRKGQYLIVKPSLSQMIRGKWISMISSKKVVFGKAKQKTEDLIFLKRLIEAGKIKAVIDRCYPLEQIVEAHRYVESGIKKGNVVINVQNNKQA